MNGFDYVVQPGAHIFIFLILVTLFTNIFTHNCTHVFSFYTLLSRCTHNNNNNHNNKHAYVDATNSFTHLRVLLVLTDGGILAQSNLRR
jgi:hypothetical protein